MKESAQWIRKSEKSWFKRIKLVLAEYWVVIIQETIELKTQTQYIQIREKGLEAN